MFKNYSMNQLILPLDLEIKLQNNDSAFSIHHLVESIPQEALEPFLRNTGCPAYHPLLQIGLLLRKLLVRFLITLRISKKFKSGYLTQIVDLNYN